MIIFFDKKNTQHLQQPQNQYNPDEECFGVARIPHALTS